jgi:hypothetical protein
MKNCKYFRRVKIYFCSIFALVIFSVLNYKAYSQNTNVAYKISPEDVIGSVHMKWFQVSKADMTVRAFADERRQLIVELINIFQNTNTLNFNRCNCAYYLGEMRASEAADSLASMITLKFDYSHVLVQGIPVDSDDPVFNALIKIGSPAIPAIIRNLAENDDPKVRELSLKALYQIDGDKDIVRLRTQKALKTETQTHQQARLQSALDALDKTSF